MESYSSSTTSLCRVGARIIRRDYRDKPRWWIVGFECVGLCWQGLDGGLPYMIMRLLVVVAVGLRITPHLSRKLVIRNPYIQKSPHIRPTFSTRCTCCMFLPVSATIKDAGFTTLVHSVDFYNLYTFWTLISYNGKWKNFENIHRSGT